MGDEESTTDESGLRLRDVPVVALVAVLWLGIPAVLFVCLWLAAFVAVERIAGVAVPGVTGGLVAAAGGPPTVAGVPTLLVVVAGALTWLGWFVRYGRHGGDSESSGSVQERDRAERRWDV